MSGFAPTVRPLPSTRGLHLNQGPIDLVARCEGESSAVDLAYTNVERSFLPVLQTLVDELPLLRQELPRVSETLVKTRVWGPVAKRMLAACLPFSRYRVSPMAAVAGSVADHLLEAMTSGAGIDKAWVNNGGDIAVHVANGRVFDCGILPDVLSNQLNASFRIKDDDGIGGVATSGRATFGQGGRSFSLGIADSVTVLAANAATADVAATLIANSVDLPGHPAINREPACSIDCDSDLGERLVVTGVDELSSEQTEEAIAAGLAVAGRFQRQGLIHTAVLTLNNSTRVCD